MKAISRSLFLLLVILACVGCDQATKSLAQTALGGRAALDFMNGTLRLVYVENPGAFLSVGAGLSAEWRFWLFVVFSGLMLAAFVWLALRTDGTWPHLSAFALLIGGGCGNLIDRASLGFVRDFAQVQVGYLQTGVFNLGDASIMIGCLLLVVKPPDVFSRSFWKRGIE
jgi:signal peptidase II